MSTWYEAHQNNVEATNNAMAEYEGDDIRAIWEPTANALLDSIPDDFETNWVEEFELAKSLGPDFVGVTSDTRKVVSWGADNGKYRELIIH